MKQIDTESYWQFYPRREDVALASVTRLPGEAGVKINLRSDMPEFSRFMYTVSQHVFDDRKDGRFFTGRHVEAGAEVDESRTLESSDGEIVVAIENAHSPLPTDIALRVQAVSSRGVSSKTHSLFLQYYPRRLYEGRGSSHAAVLEIRDTDIPLTYGHVEDWTGRPGEESVRYAREKWGAVIAGGSSDYEAAALLAKSLLDVMAPHHGVPPDNLKGTPFEQYELLLSGNYKCACGQFAGIFCEAANALGIPCRRISIHHERDVLPKDGYHLMVAPGHATTEIFSRSLNRWIWMDLSLRVLGVYLNETGPIHSMELLHFASDPVWAKHLTAVEYDPAARRERRVPIAEIRCAAMFKAYYKAGQQFRYFRGK